MKPQGTSQSTRGGHAKSLSDVYDDVSVVLPDATVAPPYGIVPEFGPNTPLEELRNWGNVQSGVVIKSEFWRALHERLLRVEDFMEAVLSIHQPHKKLGRCKGDCLACRLLGTMTELKTARILMGGKR